MNDILFNNINTEERKKCGEIFVSKIGKFHIYCSLCDKEYINCKTYIIHILEYHLELNNINIKANIETFLLPKEISDIVDSTNIKNLKENTESDICEIALSEFVLINKNSDEIYGNKIDFNQSADCFDNNSIPSQTSSENTTEQQKQPKILTRYRKKNKKDSILNEKLIAKDEKSNSTDNNENEDDNTSCTNDKCKLQCQFCGKNFSYKSQLLRHEDSHLKLKKVKNINASDSRKLIKKNDRNQKHVCEHCGKETISYFNMKIHLRVHDQNRVTYNCHLCSKKFFRKYTLESHIRLHLNDKKFACQYCGKCFVDEIRKKTHEKIHTHERPFQCNVCNKRFLYKSKLNEHTLIYHIKGRIFECDECDKRFYDEYTLSIHKPSHSTEKPFCCDQCPSKFPRKSGLLIHKKLHSDKKDYVCKICGKDFAQYNGIYAHMKSHGIKYSLAYEKGLCEPEKIV